MAKKPGKKKPAKAVGSRVAGPPNATLGKRVGHAVISGIAARYLVPTIAHVAGLPSRLGIGLDDTEDGILIPPSKGTLVPSKGRPVALPPTGPNPQPYRPGAPPIHVGTIRMPSSRPSITGPQSSASSSFRDRLKKVGPFLKQPAITNALGYGVVGGTIAGPIGAGIGAGIGAFRGSKKSANEAMRKKAEALGEKPGPDRTTLQHIGALAVGVPRGIAKLVAPGAYKKAGKVAQVVKDTFGFDNEEMIIPSSRRISKSLSPGRLVMANLRMANGKINLPKQKEPEHPSKTEEGKAFRNAALEALKRANRGDTGALATALGIANLEQPQGQPQPMGQANGVALPSPGRIQGSMTRDKREKEGKMRASMDQLNNLTRGMSPQNPIGMDAEEQTAMLPSSMRSTEAPLSPGRQVMKSIREREALKPRMVRASKPGENGVEELSMANKGCCDTCGCCPCCCTKPSSSRVNSPGRKVMAELRQQKVVRQKMEKVIDPMPLPSTRQDVDI